MEAVTLPLAFFAGMAAFASPCFLPVVPVLMVQLIGVAHSPTQAQRYPSLANAQAGSGFLTPSAFTPATTGPAPETRPTRQAAPTSSMTEPSAPNRAAALLNAAAFIAAFSAVFIGLWALVAGIGWVAGDLRPALRIIGGSFLVMMGLHSTGLLRISMLDRALRFGGPDAATAPGVRKSALLGLAFGAGWSPCIGPVLGAILGLALTSGSTASGFALLVVFCLGLGTPILLMALGLSGLGGVLRWSSRHHRQISISAGVLMIAMGVLMITDLLSWLGGITWFGI